jgi:hypothetical protein
VRRVLVAVLAAVLLAVLGAGGLALAASTHGPTLEVSVIQASQSDAGASIDPRLKDLPQLTRDQPFVRYNVYKLLDRRSFPLDVGKPVTYAIVDGRTLQVTLGGVSVDKNEKRYQMAAQIGEPGKEAFLKSLQVTASANEPFFIGGQSYQGGTLFLELVVRP